MSDSGRTQEGPAAAGSRLVDSPERVGASVLDIRDEEITGTPAPTPNVAPGPLPASAPPAAPEIIDVWSRTAPKYRIRAIAMVLLLLLLFALLCCFTFWLRTGVFWPFDSDQYAPLMQRSFRPTGVDQITLTDFLLAPISVKDVPVHGVIMGLLFASLCSIPVLVAILYRFPISLLFAAMVCFLAVMPWLGITIVGGCLLASLPRFRFRFRYASALLGLTPIAIYFVMASWEPAGGRIRSVENVALLYAPWVLALLGSCVIAAVVLAIARLINYRPGGIAPVLAVLFLTPVLLFHFKVGRDELNYRILEREIGPGSRTMFVAEDLGQIADREATRQWSRRRDVSYDEVFRAILAEEIERVRVQLDNDRERAAALCDEFIEHFPRSPYILNVLYLKGQALDQRLNRVKLFQYHRAEYRSDMPSPRSAGAWQSLAEQMHAIAHPSSGDEPAVSAMHRLAILRVREGRFAEAMLWLDKVLFGKLDTARPGLDGLAPISTRDAPSTGQPPIASLSPGVSSAASDRPPQLHQPVVTAVASMFRRSATAQSLGLDLEVVLHAAARLRERIAACRDDVARPASALFHGGSAERLHPLSILLALDETDPLYTVNLRSLIAAFPDTQTAAFAELELITQEPALSRRISLFRVAAEKFAGRSAGAEAMFRLAELLQEDSLLDEARSTLTELIRRHGESCWAVEARDRLASIAMTRG